MSEPSPEAKQAAEKIADFANHTRAMGSATKSEKSYYSEITQSAIDAAIAKLREELTKWSGEAQRQERENAKLREENETLKRCLKQMQDAALETLQVYQTLKDFVEGGRPMTMREIMEAEE
jgi:hypothetical protein